MESSVKVCDLNWNDGISHNWDVHRLRHLFSFGKGLNITKENLIDEGIPVISYGQVHSKTNSGTGINATLLRYVADDYLRQNKQSLVKKGDFIFADTSEDLDGVGNCVLVDVQDTIFAGYHSIIARFEGEPYAYPKYLAYQFLTDCWRSQLRSKAMGIKVYSITKKLIRDASVILPPIDEQIAIAEFLDSKCSEIDAIISDTNNQIDILEDYKKSIMYETVTHGLNTSSPKVNLPNTWMKTVPAHWKVERLKFSFQIKKNIAGKLGYDVLAVTQKGIKIKDITGNSGQLASDYSNYQLVNIGDFVMNHMDLLTGYMDCSKYTGVTSPDYRVFTPIVDIDKDYYTYVFQVCYLKKIFYGLGQGVATFGRWRLPTDAFNNFLIPIPPIDEQHRIACFLNKRISEVDAIIYGKKTSIENLQSYKKSLIHEYVFGKKRVKEADMSCQ